MKKIIFLVLSLLILSSCRVSNDTQLREISHIFMCGEPKVFVFNNHEYIYFYTSYGDVVHNPDCPCKNKTE